MSRGTMTRARSCRTIAPRLAEYLDGAADDSVRNAVEHHLPICRECAQQLRALRRTPDLLHQMPREKLSEQTKLALFETLRFAIRI